MSAAVPWPTARELAAGLPALPPAEVAVEDAVGSRLCEPLVAVADVPAQAVSAMDGFAVPDRSGAWRLAGETRAGDSPPPGLLAGCAWRVATGAVVPPGSVAVVPVERAQLQDDRLTAAVDGADHIRRPGEVMHAGDALLPAGAEVTPLVAGLAAMAGAPTLRVQPVPRVRVVVTGDEVVRGAAVLPGQVRDALGPLVPGLALAWGARTTGVGQVADDRDVLLAALAQPGADLVVVTGSSSHGPADLLHPVLVELGADLVVDGVACRPGHPMLLAVLPSGRVVVGLPGNPLAAVVAALTLLRPALAALAAAPRPARRGVTTTVALPGSGEHTALVPARVEEGRLTPTGHGGSASLWGVALGNGVAVVPPGGVAAGAELELMPLPDALAAPRALGDPERPPEAQGQPTQALEPSA